jgi:hypothetical protein
MAGLTYELWNEMMDDAVEAQAPLFQAMHSAAEKIKITRSLVETLRLEGIKEMKEGEVELVLAIELHNDGIDGFMISLIAAESLELLEEVIYDVAEEMGFSEEEVRGYQAEHGLNLVEDFFSALANREGISAEVDGDSAVFELILFDSEDVDNSINMTDGVWTWHKEGLGPAS